MHVMVCQMMVCHCAALLSVLVILLYAATALKLLHHTQQ